MQHDVCCDAVILRLYILHRFAAAEPMHICHSGCKIRKGTPSQNTLKKIYEENHEQISQYGGGGGFGVRLRYANLSSMMLGVSNSLFNYCNVTITLCLYTGVFPCSNCS